MSKSGVLKPLAYVANPVGMAMADGVNAVTSAPDPLTLPDAPAAPSDGEMVAAGDAAALKETKRKGRAANMLSGASSLTADTTVGSASRQLLGA